MRSLQAQITRAPAPEVRIRHMRLYGDKSSHSVIITVLVGNGDSVAPMPGPGYSQRTAGQSACVPPAGTIPDRRSASPAWGGPDRRSGPCPGIERRARRAGPPGSRATRKRTNRTCAPSGQLAQRFSSAPPICGTTCTAACAPGCFEVPASGRGPPCWASSASGPRARRI